MEKLLHPQQHEVLHVLYNQRRHVHRLVSIYAVLPRKLSSNLTKDQFRKTRKHLESLYFQQQNQPQINNMMKRGWKEAEVMHVYQDY